MSTLSLLTTCPLLFSISVTSPLLLAFSISIVVWMVYRFSWVTNNGLPYPPGPTPTVFLGNVTDFPRVRPWLTFADWKNVYGDVIHLRIFRQHFIILNSSEAAKDLLERRSSIYSDRPRFVLAEMMNLQDSTGLLPYGPAWRKHRSMYQHAIIRTNGLVSLRPIHTKKVKDLVSNLMNTPDDFHQHIKTFTAAIIIAAVYGHDIDSTNDTFVEVAEAVMIKATEILLSKASFIFNAFPPLRFIPSWVPGAGMKRKALRGITDAKRLYDWPFKVVESQMAMHVAPPSIVSNLLENCNSKEDKQAIKDMAASAYAAASDTTTATLGIFMYLMLIHPDVQSKAQKEIDEVVGDCLPSFEHRQSMPYVGAVLREVLRWMPVGPLGVVHRLTENDVYKSYHIPKGSIIVANLWTMNREPNTFPEPERFNPERFLNEDGALRDDLEIYTFGFGRRICAGQYLASEILWLAMANILHAFKIKPKEDDLGRDIIPEAKFDENAIIRILPFDCSITPRHAVSL